MSVKPKNKSVADLKQMELGQKGSFLAATGIVLLYLGKLL